MSLILKTMLVSLSVYAILTFGIMAFQGVHNFRSLDKVGSNIESYFSRFNNKNIDPNTPKVYEIALERGGVFGVGPGESVSIKEYPNGYSGFTFAIILEEYGIIGGFTVMLLYLWLLYRIILIARRCFYTNTSGIVIGLGFLIILPAYINNRRLFSSGIISCIVRIGPCIFRRIILRCIIVVFVFLAFPFCETGLEKSFYVALLVKVLW